VIVSFVVPIAIASFLRIDLLRPGQQATSPAKNCDRGRRPETRAICEAILSGAQGDRNLKVGVGRRKTSATWSGPANVGCRRDSPKGFGEAAGSSFFGDGETPGRSYFSTSVAHVELAMVASAC